MGSKIIDFDPDSYKEDETCFPGIKMWAKNIISLTGLKVPFRVVEFGSGSGKFSALFKNYGGDVLATDANSKMLERVEKNFSQFKLETRVAILPDVPEDIRDYDLAFNEGLIEHFPPDEAVEMIQAMERTLKSGGWVAIYMPVDTQEEGEYPYTPEKITEVFRRAGMTEINVWYNIWRNAEGKQKRHLGCIGRKKMVENDWTKFQEDHYSKNVSKERNLDREHAAIKLIEKHAPDAKRVVDVGCGDGGLVIYLVDRGYSAIGLDLPEVISACRKRYSDHEFAQDVSVYAFTEFDADQDELPEADVIIALELVEHLKNDYDFLERCARSANHIIICVPDSSKIVHNDHHLRFYTKGSMLKLLNVAGFEVFDYRLEAQSQFFYGRKK